MNILSMKFEDVPFEYRHLHPDCTYLVCTNCRRLDYIKPINSDCNFPQPNGGDCKGVLVGLSKLEANQKRSKLG